MKKDNSAQDERIILSIIIPIYNAEKFIKACLESIVIQNKDNMEIILVNDGSTDSSLKMCEEIKENIGKGIFTPNFEQEIGRIIQL